MAISSEDEELPRLLPTEEEKRRAVDEPGVPWKDWFYFSFLKVWVSLGFLILDAMVAAAWSEARNWIGLVASLVVVVYLEFLAFRFLWTRPATTEERFTEFKANWLRPVRRGRWTPEAWYPERFATHQASGRSGPDPNEFL
jgi:hypothetical protein